MPLVICDGCNAVHSSTDPVCPSCGHCPRCAQKRVTKEQMRAMAACPKCQVPFCVGCGRCHGCGVVRFADWEPCSCGFPTDPEMVKSVEKAFSLPERERIKRQGPIFLLGFLVVVLGG